MPAAHFENPNRKILRDRLGLRSNVGVCWLSGLFRYSDRVFKVQADEKHMVPEGVIFWQKVCFCAGYWQVMTRRDGFF
jgi:hypothetical protein